MTRSLTAVLLAILLVAISRAEEPRDEAWDVTTLEATSLLGEALFQSRDLSGARDRFRDSLGVSTRMRSPQAQIVAMDLYRTAELELRKGDAASARRHLDILVGRYGDTEWALRGERLLKALPAGVRAEEDDEPAAVSPDPMAPETVLKRLQAALREDAADPALAACRQFLERWPGHAAAGEVRVAQGALLLRANDPSRAAQVLEEAAGSGDASAQAKARYLLGQAYLATGDHDSLAAAVPGVDPARSDRWSALALVWRAASEEDRGEWGAAESRLRAVLRTRFDSPAKAYALAALGAALERHARPGAVETLQGARKQALRWGLESVGEHAQLSLAHVLYRHKRFAQAAQAYERFERQYPSSADLETAAFRRALALKRAGDATRAASAFRELVRAYPDSQHVQDGWLQLGQIYAAQGDARRAVEAYERMGAAGADKDAILLVAQVRYNAKRYNEAIGHYLKFLESAPDDARAPQVQDLLLSSYLLGRRDDPGLAKAVEAYPRHPVVARIRWELGSKAYKDKKYLLAERHLRRLAEDFPKSSHAPAALFYRAESLMRIENYAGAVEAYQGLAAHPRSPFARQGAFRVGLALLRMGRHGEAAEAFARYGGGAKDPLAADALYNRALVLDKDGSRSGALAAYEALLTRFPRYPRASWVWSQVGAIREELGRLTPAAMAYARVRGPGRAQALFAAGRCREKLRQRGLARKAYEELRGVSPAADPYRLKGLLRLALLYELDSPGKAVPLYREVLRHAADPAAAEVARKRLSAPTATGARRRTYDSAASGSAAVFLQ